MSTIKQLSPTDAVSLFDERPFFEKALIFGLQHGIIDQAKLDAINVEAPKGMVQIARYFGSEFLRPELEKAKERMINLISLCLQDSSGGDLQAAAESMREHSFLSRSKGGSDLLKALIAMPQNTHFGMNERGGFTDRHIPQLAKWTMLSFADYQAEFALRSRVALVVDAALWLADQFGMQADDLQDAEPDAEAVIRTTLLLAATRRKEMPDWVNFEKMIASLRKKFTETPLPTVALALTLPKDLPDDYKPVVTMVISSVQADLPKILDAKLPIRKLFDQTPAFMGRYFWIEDALSEVDHHDRTRSDAWEKLTQGHSDDGTLLTLLLCVAASVPPKTLLTDKTAATLIRKIRKGGLHTDLASGFIKSHAPEQYQDDYEQLWQDFMAEARTTLISDRDTKLGDALALLRRECNVS
jgi:hypothetical protein